MTTATIIQARMASTRLPGKVLRDLAGKPLVWHITDRLRRVPGLDGIVIATTTARENDALEDFAREGAFAVYRHEGEDDIAGRLAGAARLVGADAFLKVNGDCPLVDPEILTRLVSRFASEGSLDYVSNKVVWTYPIGLSAEVIGTRAMDWCDERLTSLTDREHVTDWIRDHREHFAVASIECDRDLSHHHWAVDTETDFAFARRIFAQLYVDGGCFGMQDVLDVIDQSLQEADPARRRDLSG